MSYSRWLGSNWYVFPCTDGTIVIWRAGEEDIHWKSGETYSEIIERVKATIKKDEEYESDIEELEDIICSNKEDIEQHIGSSEIPEKS